MIININRLGEGHFEPRLTFQVVFWGAEGGKMREITRQLASCFPDLKITEELVAENDFWVDVWVDGQFVVIHQTPDRGIGLSVVAEHTIDFSGHDIVVDNTSEAVDWAVQRINQLRTRWKKRIVNKVRSWFTRLE